jgi:hypothetical protein
MNKYLEFKTLHADDILGLWFSSGAFGYQTGNDVRLTDRPRKRIPALVVVMKIDIGALPNQQ